MSEPFDPYLKWLGIRDPKRPPNHYRLLGVDLDESDREVINSAADRRMAYVRTFQTGAHADLSQTILSELAIARRCLLDSQARTNYDLQMRAESIERPPAPTQVNIVSAQPAVIARRSKKTNRFMIDLVGWIGGGVAAVVAGYFIIHSDLMKPSVVRSSPAAVPPAAKSGPDNLVDSPLSPPLANSSLDPDKAADTAVERTPAPSAAEPLATPPSPTPGPATSPTNPTNRPKEIAPWNEKNRFPEVPDFLAKPSNAAERAFHPALIGLAMRQYESVKRFLPDVATSGDPLSSPINVVGDLNQLENFWLVVGRSAGDIQVGETLVFRNREVQVSGVSDRSIELTWPAKSTDPKSAQVKRFKTRHSSMDRDFAIALARRDSSDVEPLIETFAKYDFLHANLPTPLELSAGVNGSLPNNLDNTPSLETVAKKPIPDKELLDEARKTIRDLYQDDLQADDFFNQDRLARKWLDDASATSDPNLHYALLEEASQLAVATGNGEVVFTALAEMNDLYEIAFWDLLVTRLESARRKAKTDAQYATITNSLFDSINLAVTQEKYDLALQLSGRGFATAKSIGVVNQQNTFGQYRKQLDEMLQWTQQSDVAVKLLESDPENPAVNMAMAQYLCFVKGDWATGSSFMAKSDNQEYAAAAAQELSLTGDSQESALSLADSWYELGNQTKGAAARALLLHALGWYEKANQAATGIEAQKTRLRIQELQPLLEFFDPYQDDPALVESTVWRFGTPKQVVFTSAQFRRSRFEYEYDGKTRRLNINKTGDTYQVEPDANTLVRMRLMRNGQMELWQYNRATGKLISTGLGVPVERLPGQK
ncbi:MAG: hypothetical protein MK106_02255 [Mariniblastus sp.]|nr:hypothetical protein [Mariniblastus sp.]